MRTNSVGWLVVIMVCACCSVAGCGYNFAGSRQLPAGVETVFVPVFKNNSALLGVENDFTSSLIREFTRRRSGSLVEESRADAILSGVIKAISTATVSRRNEYASAKRRVRVRLSARLVSREGRVVWAADNISGDEVYTVEVEKHATEQNLRRAVIKLADDLAERIYNQLTASF